MFEKFNTPPALKKLLALGKAKPRHSDTQKRPYRSANVRFFWGISALFVFFLLVVYFSNGGDSGSSDNQGIYKVVIGAVIVGGLATFFAPWLNERLQSTMPSGRRKLLGRNKRSSQRRSRLARRSSQSKDDMNHPDKPQTPPVKTDF